MSKITLGHRLSRELSRRGDRRLYLWPAQYRELRKIDTVEELADFLDRNGYSRTRACEDVSVVADDMMIQSGNPPLFAEPAVVGLFSATLGILLIPLFLLCHLVWKIAPEDKSKP